MSEQDYYADGDWNASCSMCGRTRKASQLVRNWQGQYRCPEHNDTRQPQDFVRSIPEHVTVPWAQPPAFIYSAVCSPNGISAVPEWAEPGCATPGYLSSAFDPNATI